LITADKENFKVMMNIVMTNYGRKQADQDTLRYWFAKLEKHDLAVVSKAFDTWIDSQSNLPTYHDIAKLCQPQVTIYARLPSPLAIADNKRHAEEVKEAINTMTKPKRDFKAWARKIVGNPSAYPDISLRYANEAIANKAA
jgi:hypothetical protein